MEHAANPFSQVPVNKVCAAQKLIVYRDAARLGEWLEMEIRQLYADGLLFPTDYCRREGMMHGQRLDQFVRPEQPRRPSLFQRG
jgi:hypothetical protein